MNLTASVWPGLYWALASLQMDPNSAIQWIPRLPGVTGSFVFSLKAFDKKRGVRDQDGTHRRLFLLRSTQMKATSSTAKPRGSTSASPWWTSLRSASGYQRWRSKACWRRRGKKRVSWAPWPVHAQQAFPVLPLTPSWSSFLSTTPTVLISPPFPHHLMFIWSPGIRMLKPRLPFRLRTDLLTSTLGPRPQRPRPPDVWNTVLIGLCRAERTCS